MPPPVPASPSFQTTSESTPVPSAPGAGKVPPQREGLRTRLIQQKYFTVDRIDLNGQPFQSEPPAGIPQSLVAIEGEAVLHAKGCPRLELIPGRAVVVPAGVEDYRLEADAKALVIRSQPTVSA